MLPHVMFSSLSQHYPETFDKMYAMHHCEAFWRSAEKLKDPRLVKPITLSKGRLIHLARQFLCSCMVMAVSSKLEIH